MKMKDIDFKLPVVTPATTNLKLKKEAGYNKLPVVDRYNKLPVVDRYNKLPVVSASVTDLKLKKEIYFGPKK